MKVSRLLLAIVATCAAVTALAQTATTVYVSPSGSDSNPGTQVLPKQSIYGGMDAVRQSRAAGTTGQFVVQIAPGTYSFNKVLAIGPNEGGAVGAPLIFRAETKDVFFDGSRPVSGWQRLAGEMYGVVPAAARDKVFMAPLPSSGSAVADTSMDTGAMNKRGYGIQTSKTWSTLVFNGTSMELAKHPNAGWLTVPQDHNGSATSIALAEPAPYGWRNTGDVWAYGFYAWDWADSFENVSGFDAASGRMNLATQPGYGIKKGQRYLLVNAIEALDAPSEYFIDRTTGVVYFYPPLAGQTDAQIVASLNAGTKLTSCDASFVETSSASDVTFENITFQNGRRSAAVVRYGNRVAFKGCTFKRFNYHAVVVVNGFSHLFQSCDFMDLDESGIVLSGGDRVNLVPSGHLIINCHFKDFAKLCRAYRPAISARGVGNTVQNCRIEEAPHSGVVLHGNNNVVTRSEFNRLCLQTSDSAAVYIGRNPTYQGNKVTFNKFQDVWTQLNGNYSNFTAGVYMDDMVSNLEVNNNIFKNVQIGIVLGGGRDIKLDNNYFFNNGRSVHFDARGTSWASDFMARWNVPGMLAEVPYQQNPWAVSYPYLPNYLNDDPERPKRDTLTHNVSVGSLDWLLLLDGLTTSSDLSTNPAIYAANNSVTVSDPGFVDMANENFNPTSASALTSLGIKPIDTTLIGLYADQYRAIGSSNTLPPPEPAPDVDMIAPSTPTGLKTVSGPSTGQVSLSWTASIDDSGTVLRYDLYRSSRATSGFSFIASSAKASYVDSAGRGKTRYYYVVAVDGAGNKSASSATVSGVGKK